MKLAYKQIELFLKKPDAQIPVVLVYGPDEGLVRERAALLAKTVVADLKDPFLVAEITPESLRATPSLLTDEAQSMSMLGGRRVVRVVATAAEGDALKGLDAAVAALLASITPADNFIVIEAGNLPASSKLRKDCEASPLAAALPCYAEEERDVARVIEQGLRAENYTIDREALAHMAAHVVGDRAVVRGEIDKLITYMGPENRAVSLEDVVACVGDSAELSMDQLSQFAASGRFAEAERVLTTLLGDGTSFVVVTRALQNYLLRLHVARLRVEGGDSADAAMAKLKPPLFWKVKDAFASQLQNWTVARLDQALAIVLSAEFKCKQTGADPALILSRALLAITQLAGATQRRRA